MVNGEWWIAKLTPSRAWFNAVVLKGLAMLLRLGITQGEPAGKVPPLAEYFGRLAREIDDVQGSRFGVLRRNLPLGSLKVHVLPRAKINSDLGTRVSRIWCSASLN
jgi:hypothetical protein